MSHNRLRMSSVICGGMAYVMGLGVGFTWAQDPPEDALLIGQWDGYDGIYSDVWSDGNYAYMGNWSLADGQAARLMILDISDPMNPTLASTYFFPSPNQFASPQDVKVADGLAFVSLEGDGNDGVAILDVRVPTDPSLLATVRLEDFEDTHNVYYDSGYLYMADSQTPRVGILDLTDFDPDNPPPSPMTEALWILEDVGSAFVHDVFVKDGRLYCAAWDSGLRVYNVADVANSAPTFLGSVAGESTHSMWVTDDNGFVVTGEEREGGGIKVYEITGVDFLHFTLRDSLILSDEAFSVHNQYIVGNRLYVSWYQAGLRVFDINPDTGELEFRSSYDTSVFENDGSFNGAWGIYAGLGDDEILVSDMQNGLHVIAGKLDDCTVVEDCNGNGIDDLCDLIEGTSGDCNQTFVPDECEIEAGSSDDCQNNGIPDECEPDCNDNGVADECDIDAGDSLDCQLNGVPDECEADCNSNAVPDDCDITNGTSDDCQPNGVPDECDIEFGPSIQVLMLQVPNQQNGWVADADDHPIFDPTTGAENFVTEYPTRIESVVIWGAYIINNVPGVDDFTLNVYADEGGLPGDVIYSEPGVQSSREKTGIVVFGFWDEWEVTITPSQPIELDPGTYFVEIFNNTDDISDTFIWETSDTGQIPGAALGFEVPAEQWFYDSFFNLAMRIDGPLIGNDCNATGTPDECDIVDGTSSDENGNYIPDECDPCDGDVNDDGVVDPLDSGYVLSRFGCEVGTGDPDCDAADANVDGVVDPLDTGYVLSRFGECP